MELMRKEVIEDLVVIGGLIGAQMIYAGNSVLLSFVMSLGLNPLSIVIFSSFATFLLVSPFAAYFERTKWPQKLNFKLLVQLILLSLGGVTLFQSLMLKGIMLTSPAMATAMASLSPGLIFIIAWIFRLEKVKLSCHYSRAKILGTLLCVIGALTMSLVHSQATEPEREAQPFSSSSSLYDIFDKQKIIGCSYLSLGIFIFSSTIVLQASTLREFPAPLSLCSSTSFIGAIATCILEVFEDHRFDIGLPVISIGNLIGFYLLGGIVNGAIMSFNGWAIKKRGPVMVSVFNPIGAVCSIILSIFTLGDTIKMGSLAGMFVLFAGFYLVLWAKGKEGLSNGDCLESEVDEEKPLLSSMIISS